MDFFGTTGSDTITGTESEDFIEGGPAGFPESDTGADRLSGLGGTDVIRGYGGPDTLLGGAGGDFLEAEFQGEGPGSVGDRLDGGLGGDTLVSAGFDDVLIGGGGRDLLIFDGVNLRVDVTFDLQSTDQFTTIVGDGSRVKQVEVFNFSGGHGDDRIAAGDLNDSLFGARGNDVVDGRDGNDLVDGGVGNDTVSGGAGNDTLRDGRGDDVLIGASGRDQFQVDLGNDRIFTGARDGSVDRIIVSDLNLPDPETDRIFEFENGIDRLDLQDFGFSSFQEIEALARDVAGGTRLQLDLPNDDTLIIDNFNLAAFDRSDVII